MRRLDDLIAAYARRVFMRGLPNRLPWAKKAAWWYVNAHNRRNARRRCNDNLNETGLPNWY